MLSRPCLIWFWLGRVHILRSCSSLLSKHDSGNSKVPAEIHHGFVFAERNLFKPLCILASSPHTWQQFSKQMKYQEPRRTSIQVGHWGRTTPARSWGNSRAPGDPIHCTHFEEVDKRCGKSANIEPQHLVDSWESCALWVWAKEHKENYIELHTCSPSKMWSQRLGSWLNHSQILETGEIQIKILVEGHGQSVLPDISVVLWQELYKKLILCTK